MGKQDTEMHYDWSSMPSVLSEEETARRLAEAEHHSRDKAAVDRGHTLRLLIAAPVVVWSLGLMAAVIVLVAVPTVQALFGAADDFSVDAWVAAFVVTVVLAETAAIWSALILIRDVIRPVAWLVIIALSVAALATAVVMLLAAGDGQQVDFLAVAAISYVLVVALLELPRARRLSRVVDEVERWYP